MKKGILCTAIVTISILGRSQTLQYVTDLGNTTNQPIYVNKVLANNGNSVMVHGRGNTVNTTSTSNSYIYGYMNTINTLNSTVAGYQNTISANSNSVSVFGQKNTVGGHAPMVFGYRNYLATGTDKSMALGRDNAIYGYSTFALGNRNTVDGNYANAIGNFNNASSDKSTALGYNNTASGSYSIAIGVNSVASAVNSFSFGYGNVVSANYASAYGYGLTNNISASLMIGCNDDSKMTFLSNGNILIGKTTQANSNYKLDIAGVARANKVVVNSTGADFVFDSSYQLPPLAKLEAFIQENKHLPDIASAKEMQKDGLDIGELQTKLLQKVEELTLYMIAQSKKIEEQQAEINALKTQVLKK